MRRPRFTQMWTTQKERADAAERELERWKHNLQVEGDYVCPDSLRADAAEARVKDLEDEARTCRGGHNHNTLRKLNAEVARLQERVRELERDLHHLEELDRSLTHVGAVAVRRIAALESQVKVKDEALHATKSQLTQYWAYLSSDRVEDAEAILDAALGPAATKETP